MLQFSFCEPATYWIWTNFVCLLVFNLEKKDYIFFSVGYFNTWEIYDDHHKKKLQVQKYAHTYVLENHEYT